MPFPAASNNLTVTITMPDIRRHLPCAPIRPAYLGNLMRGVYLGMLDKLKAGNVAAALNSITAGVHAEYSAISNDIGANLPAVIDQLGVIKQGALGDEMAEYVIVRRGSNGLEGYTINLIRSEDGIWRIDGM